MIYRLLFILLIASLSGFSMVPDVVWADAAETASAQTHEGQIADWRQRRHERLANDNGWLTLVGLEWLQEGENRVGSSSSSTIRIFGGPADWGTIFVNGDELKFVPAQDSGVRVNDSEATEVMLVADNQAEPTVVRSGNLSFYVIFRESYALRVKDRQAPALQEFTGVKNYEFQPDWRFDARFVPAEEGQTIEIANVLGHLSPSPVYGFVEFERDGVNYRLLGLGDEDSESLWFLFADRTSGRETYGAGRFLYSDGLPRDGRVIVDFNKAYNPPCVFNEYSTCPLPPQQNRLDLAVTAGEKDYHSK
jgi:uncharacterized protein (DUF1684 family)